MWFFISSAGSWEHGGTCGIIPGHLPSELRMPRLALPRPARGVDLERPDSRHHAFRGRELGETCHRPGPGTEGGLLHIGLPFFPGLRTLHRHPPPRVGQATIPGLSPTRRQTNTALRPRSQSPGRAVCVWPELYLRAHIVRFWPEDRGEEVGGSEKA